MRELPMRSEGAQPVRLLWGLFCDYFMLDVSGKQSFVGVFEQIAARSFPAQHKLMNVVCALQGPPGLTAPGLLTIWTPDDTILLSTPEMTVKFNPAGRALVVNMLYDLPLPGPGIYNLVLEIGGRPAGELTLELSQAQG